MARKHHVTLAAALAILGMAASANAQPPFPPYQCPWLQDKDCPRSSYCCLHYWAPSYYSFWAYHTPPRYVYGCPTDPAFSGFRIDKYPCRATSSAEQASHYANMRRFDPGAAGGEQSPTAPAAPESK
jgi:hypothetical protein